MALEKINNVKGKAVFVPGNDIDTDRIIPARFMVCVTFEGLGKYAFYDERKNADGSDNTNYELAAADGRTDAQGNAVLIGKGTITPAALHVGLRDANVTQAYDNTLDVEDLARYGEANVQLADGDDVVLRRHLIGVVGVGSGVAVDVQLLREAVDVADLLASGERVGQDVRVEQPGVADGLGVLAQLRDLSA